MLLLETKILIYQHYLDSAFRKGLLGNGPGVADPIRAFAFFAIGGFHTGGLFIQTHGIDRGHIIFNAIDGFVNITDDFVATNKYDYPFGAKVSPPIRLPIISRFTS